MPRTALPPLERRQAILRAAEELFLRQGFEATQVSQIVKNIGAAQGTFYNYFGSKEAVLSEIFQNIWGQFLEAVEANRPPGPALVRLQAMLGGIFQPPSQAVMDGSRWEALTRLLEHPTAHNLFDEARIQVLGPRIQKIVLAGITEGTFKPYTCTPESIEIIFLGVNTYLHQHADEFSDPQALLHHMTAIQEVLARGLGLEPGALQLIPHSHP